MLRILRSALTLLLLFTVLLGLAYPAVVTGFAQLVFPRQANGSAIDLDGRTVGSGLVGQRFARPDNFWGRPSATSPEPYRATASTGSNLGPSNPALRAAVAARVEALRMADPGDTRPIPVDLVTTSASGLDPHISPAAAYYQVPRVARNRGLPETTVRSLVDAHREERLLGLFGEPRVNVLRLNLALNRLEAGGPR
jgi:K+-transporting ATPase ATPase C chain